MAYRLNAFDDPANYRRLLLLVLFVAIVLRVGFFLLARPWVTSVLDHKILVGDAPGYRALALRILSGQRLKALGSYRTPGYPVLQAVVYKLFGDRPWVVLLLQIAANILTLFLLYRLAASWFNQKAALAAALLYAFEPHAILYACELYSDAVFTTTVIASLLLFHKALTTRKAAYYFVTGLLVGVATLIRPVGEFLPVALTVLTIVYFRNKWAVALRGSAVLILGFIVAIAPWLYRNYREYDALALTSVSGDMLLNWEVAYTESAQTGKPVAQIRSGFAKLVAKNEASRSSNPFTISGVQKALALHYIERHPFVCAKAGIKGAFDALINLDTSGYANLLGIKTAPMHGWFSGASLWNRLRQFIQRKPGPDILIGVLISSYLVGVYSLVVLGAYFLLRERNYWPLVVTVSMTTYFLMFIGPIGLARYKMPTVPFYTVLAGFALFRISRPPERDRSHKEVAPVV